VREELGIASIFSVLLPSRGRWSVALGPFMSLVPNLPTALRPPYVAPAGWYLLHLVCLVLACRVLVRLLRPPVFRQQFCVLMLYLRRRLHIPNKSTDYQIWAVASQNFARGSLPWQGLKAATDEEKDARIKEMKEGLSGEAR